jgi:hypothetical protein
VISVPVLLWHWEPDFNAYVSGSLYVVVPSCLSPTLWVAYYAGSCISRPMNRFDAQTRCEMHAWANPPTREPARC